MPEVSSTSRHQGTPCRHISVRPTCAEEVLASLETPIAVVGNATPTRAWGSVIDRYATIVRLNNFRVEGFEHLVGRRTDLRCTSGWYDIEHRAGLVEISPFTASARESENLAAFVAANHGAVTPARLDVRPLIAETPNPSTGLSLAQLLDSVGVPADLFCFDGFRTPHYWRSDLHTTSHSGDELAALVSREMLAVMTDTVDYRRQFEGRHAQLMAAREAGCRALAEGAGVDGLAGRVLDLATVDGCDSVARRLSRSQVMSQSMVPASTHSGLASPSQGVLPLALLDGPFDALVAVDLLHELHPNDVRIVLRQAARLAPRFLGTIRTAETSTPSDGEPPLRSTEWWMTQLASCFDVALEPGEGFVTIRGVRRGEDAIRLSRSTPRIADEAGEAFHIHAGYTARTAPTYFPDLDDGVIWQPDVYRLLADLASTQGCRRVVDLGCGRARKLVDLHPAFDIVGVDVGANLAYCRDQFAFGRWVEADFERPTSLPAAINASLEDAVVCSDVIEHLTDPSALMATLSALLEYAPFAILTTPERDLTHGLDHDGPPPNPAHVREWNAEELAGYARDCGLDVALVCLTASHSVSFEPQTTLLLLAGRRLTGGDRDHVVASCRARLDAYAAARIASSSANVSL